MTSDKASQVKRKGHEDAEEFVQELGIGKEFKCDPRAKKDVIDEYGRSYSVKSGEKKWQIFLYGENRFKNDFTFQGIDGLGQIFIECIESFPPRRSDYLDNKNIYKARLQKPMVKLAEKLKEKRLLASFIDKGIFNSGEVDFLVIKHENLFHLFWGRDVVNILTSNFNVENSQGRTAGQMACQKVVFKYLNRTIGEIEMRNDSDLHYREVKFWLAKNLTFELLTYNIKAKKKFRSKIILYGGAINKFKRQRP
ncbi:MAG: hypothetical protein WBK32_02255 [Candidatus Saccharicenans sp.]